MPASPPRLVSGWSCPICGETLRRPKPVYGVSVCRRCCYAFANRRQAAWLVDYVVVIVILACIEWLVGFIGVGISATRPPVAILALPLLLKDGFNGMSPGKWVCGVQVVHAEKQQPIGLWRSMLRNLPLYAPLMLEFWSKELAYGVLVVILLHVGSQLVRGRRWGDWWAKTKVVWRPYAHKAPFDLRGILCTACGYDLTGNVSGVCPECGTTIARRSSVRAASAD